MNTSVTGSVDDGTTGQIIPPDPSSVPGNLTAVGMEENVGTWNPVFGAWGNLGDVGGWKLKMITRNPQGRVYAVGRHHNVGLWNGSGWTDQGHMFGWHLKMLAWAPNGSLWCVGAEGNVGEWNGITGAGARWNDQGELGGWNLKMLTFDSVGDLWGVGAEGNVGRWNGTDWDNYGFVAGGSVLHMIAFNGAPMWFVRTDGDTGVITWRANGSFTWTNFGDLGGWKLSWLYFH